MVFLKNIMFFIVTVKKFQYYQKFFIIKNNHFNLISLALLFNNVDLIFIKKMLYFSDISREDSFKISPWKKFIQKYMSIKMKKIKIILNKFNLIYEENCIKIPCYIYFCVGEVWKNNMNLISKYIRNIFVYWVVYI